MASFFSRQTSARHYSSTASVSSLSVSSISSQDHAESQHSTQTSWSDRRTWTVYGKYVDGPDSSDSLRAPSPLDPGPEDEAETERESGGGRDNVTGQQHVRRRASPTDRTEFNVHQTRAQAQAQASEDDRPWCIPTPLSPAVYQFRRPSEPIRGTGTGGSPIPSFPENFAKYFPSNYPISIYHPQTSDGNMNLALDVQTCDGPVTLFHMRMHHMRSREFALRRYCRESMRQVCRSTTRKSGMGGQTSGKKGIKGVAMQGLGKLLRHGEQDTAELGGRGALTSRRRSKDTGETMQKESDLQARKDSGYESDTVQSLHSKTSQQERSNCPRDSVLSHMGDQTAGERSAMNEEDEDPMLDNSDEEEEADETDSYLPKDTARLEFSNYSHLTIRRRTASKYQFEYWGSTYTWKLVQKTQMSTKAQRRHTIAEAVTDAAADGPTQSTVEFHLYVEGRVGRIATIVPDEMSRAAAADEADAGGWVPPSKLQILDEQTLMAPNGADVCDVIVATGLQALLDDCIRRRWDESESKFSHLPGARIISGIQWPKLSMSISSPRKLGSGREDTGRDCSKASASRRMSFGLPRRNTAPRSSPSDVMVQSGENASQTRRKSTPGNAFEFASATNSKSSKRRISGFLSGWAAKQESPETLVKRGSPLRKPSMTAHA